MSLSLNYFHQYWYPNRAPENHLHCPLKVTVEISIHSLHVLESDLLLEDHLIEGTDEESVQETAVENGQTYNTPDELEVVQMFRVDTRVRVDLESVVVVRRVLKQTVEGVEHLMRQQEEEFSGQTTVIQTVFAIELDHQALLQVTSTLSHDLVVRVLEDMTSADLNVALAGNNPQCRLGPEVDQLPPEITLVLRHVLIQRRRQPGVVPRGGLGVVINEVDTRGVGQPHFPAARQWPQL